MNNNVDSDLNFFRLTHIGHVHNAENHDPKADLLIYQVPYSVRDWTEHCGHQKPRYY